MAEAFFNKYSQKHSATSAGTNVGEKDGQKIGQNEKARFVWRVMDEEGIDVRNYKRKQLTQELVQSADRVVVITEKQYCPDFLLQSPKTVYWDIPDAKGTDYQTHVKTREEIKKRTKALLEELANE